MTSALSQSSGNQARLFEGPGGDSGADLGTVAGVVDVERFAALSSRCEFESRPPAVGNGRFAGFACGSGGTARAVV